MIIFWKIKHGTTIKHGWCHNQPVDDAIKAVLYQTSIPLSDLRDNDSTVEFRYRNAINLGIYYFNGEEFYPSSEYDNNPDLAKL